MYNLILISFIKIIVALDFLYFKTYKMTRIQVSVSSDATVIAIIRLSATGGSHFEFFKEKVDVKNGNSFFRSLGSFLCEKSSIIEDLHEKIT